MNYYCTNPKGEGFCLYGSFALTKPIQNDNYDTDLFICTEDTIIWISNGQGFMFGFLVCSIVFVFLYVASHS